MLHLLRRLTPRPIMRAYHYTLARLAALMYGSPSEKLLVIGVTGTKGKSSTVHFLYKIFEAAGLTVGATSTAELKIGKEHTLNDTKMSMLGRLRLQNLLARMVASGCQVAIIETTSQGVEQFRHRGINYDAVLFTNLTPEHIEAHGGFESYKKAKGKLFAHLGHSRPKRWEKLRALHGSAYPVPSNGVIAKRAIVNLDSEHANFFLSQGKYETWGFTFGTSTSCSVDQLITARKDVPGRAFSIGNTVIHLHLAGEHNLANALAATTVALSQGITLEVCQSALENVTSLPGRLEYIENQLGLNIIVDYAYEPASMAALYATVAAAPGHRLIQVVGSAGGGRDTARRAVLGEMAAHAADIVIVTNEDPYDEDPQRIIDQIAHAAHTAGKTPDQDLFAILDRRQAIAHALTLARTGDTLLITGKGCEQAMAVADGRKIPWDDRAVVREELEKLPQ